MGDPTFADAIAGRTWIVEPDPFAYVEPGWAAIFRAALDRAGELMVRHPGAVLRGLGAQEKHGSLRVRSFAPPPPEIEDEVRVLWRGLEHRSAATCQVCGRSGRLRTDGLLWWATACDDHA